MAKRTYTHIPQVDVAAFIAEHGKPYDPDTDDYRRPPFAESVKAGKNTPIYRAHSYHTKVPPQGIVPYIKHYTEPGDLVLDPFCGSGMTGVACSMTGRYAILNDLSPAATHIAYSYCTPVDVDGFQREFERIEAAVREEFDWLYGTTCDRCGVPATIHYTIWSDVFECGRCRAQLLLWDVARDPQTGKLRREFACTACGLRQTKHGLSRLFSLPMMIGYTCPACSRNRGKRPVSDADKRHIAEIESRDIPYWYPADELPLGRQTRKVRRGTAGISRVDQFYTVRNLWALSALWHHIAKVEKPRCRRALQFVFTAIALRCSKLNRLRPGGAGDPLPGTLYVSSFVREDNVLVHYKNKASSYLRYVRAAPTIMQGSTLVTTASATSLQVPDGVVDYVFADPPFGSNLQYAELNFIWEAWLREFTDWPQDCVMNYVHAKDLSFYRDMMSGTFLEMYRVLKPDRWASIVFHNTDDAVWRAIQEGAEQAGFEVVNALAFDKGGGTFNQVSMGKESAAGFDIVLNLRKPRRQTVNAKATSAAHVETRVVEAVAAHLSGNPSLDHRTTQFLHSLAIRQLLNHRTLVEKVTIPYLETVLPHYFKRVDRHWYLGGEGVVGGRGIEIRDETDAIAWLTAVLGNEPQTTGDLIPQWQIAMLNAPIAKPLDQVLKENFWHDGRTGRWRIPTASERERMSAQQEVADLARMRRIRRYVGGELDLHPTDAEVCSWIQFAYEHKMYDEAVRLFAVVHRPHVDDELHRRTRKIVQVCRLRSGRPSDDSQLPLL